MMPSKLSAQPVDTRSRVLDRMPFWVATGRYGVRPAPGGLALVQDFLNTRASAEGPDLLCDAAHAEAWAASAITAWSAVIGTEYQPLALTDNDAVQLRDVCMASRG